MKIIKILSFLTLFLIFLNGCNGKMPGGDARKSPADPKKRIEQNLKEGRGFKLMDLADPKKSGTFDFASSNELWRASLDTIDFMPLVSVNYSGGIIITDWYSDQENSNESIKITIRFLTNEIRSDSLDIKIFKKICMDNFKCKIVDGESNLAEEITRQILKTATIYKAEDKDSKK